jgi:hypothetical protein
MAAALQVLVITWPGVEPPRSRGDAFRLAFRRRRRPQPKARSLTTLEYKGVSETIVEGGLGQGADSGLSQIDLMYG